MSAPETDVAAPARPRGRQVRVISDKTIIDIRVRAQAGESYGRIARSLGLDRSYVSRVARGMARRKVLGPTVKAKREGGARRRLPRALVERAVAAHLAGMSSYKAARLFGVTQSYVNRLARAARAAMRTAAERAA